MADSLSGPSPAIEPQVRRADQARILMAGDEVAALYFWTDRLVFSASEVPPGGRSTRDPGHSGADEVCYVTDGELVIEFPGLQRWERLGPGDAIVIPEGEPHVVFNPGDTVARSVWATAPHLGYELEDLTGVPEPTGEGQ